MKTLVRRCTREKVFARNSDRREQRALLVFEAVSRHRHSQTAWSEDRWDFIVIR
jgi:hypothetical protein